MSALAMTAATAGAIMATGWLASLRVRDASIVDPLWGITFVAAGWAIWLWDASATVTVRTWLMLAMVTVWGVRLGAHLTARKRGEPEDPRYAAMRRRRRRIFTLWSLVMVFGLQGALIVVVSLPVQAVVGASGDPPGLGPLDWLGCAVWAVGLAFETVGDEQLRRFKSDPANRSAVLDRGLWRYTRHPNYFGDFCVWWGIYLVAAAGGGTWTVAGPVVMSVLLVRVSGVPMLERTIADRRPGYADYVRRTSAFVPLPPRRAGEPARQWRDAGSAR